MRGLSTHAPLSLKNFGAGKPGVEKNGQGVKIGGGNFQVPVFFGECLLGPNWKIGIIVTDKH